jgi:hypothetical protein
LSKNKQIHSYVSVECLLSAKDCFGDWEYCHDMMSPMNKVDKVPSHISCDGQHIQIWKIWPGRDSGGTWPGTFEKETMVKTQKLLIRSVGKREDLSKKDYTPTWVIYVWSQS